MARLKVLAAGGEHPSPKLSAKLHRAGPGYGGSWMPDTVFGLQRKRRGKRKREKQSQEYVLCQSIPGSAAHSRCC